MKILMMGDSITDMFHGHNDFSVDSYGDGYVFFVEGELSTKFPKEYEIYNRGIGGNRIVDVYARMKVDCWNLAPNFISILVGVNDLWHEIDIKNGVELHRFERIYRTYIEETQAALPNVQFMLLEPFVLRGSATTAKWEEFSTLREYAKVVKKIAKEKGIAFVALQEKFDALAKEYGAEHWLYDGVHPTVAGARIIADAWLEKFYELIK